MKSLGAFIALASLAGLARGETRAAVGGAAQGVLGSAVVDVDPLSRGTGDEEIAALVFDGLFRFDDAGKAVPQLAVGLSVEMPLYARVRLRDSVRTHDGKLLRAAQVASSLERALHDPAGWTLAPIRAARPLGDDAIELELSRPAPDLPLLLASPQAAIAVARHGGTGPFHVTTTDGGSVRLEAHAGCFAGRPYLDQLVLRTFDSRTNVAGTFQVGALAAARYVTATGATRTSDGPLTITAYLAFGRGLTDDAARLLRAALDRGIERNRLRRLAVRDRSIPAAGAPPALGGTATLLPWDPAAARTLLDPLPGRTFTLLIDRTRLDDRPVADRIVADLSALGLTLKIEQLEAAAYRERLRSGQYELLLGESAPPAPDGGLAELALLAEVDPAPARALLARGPATLGLVDFTKTRVLPLFHRAPRVVHVAPLRGLALDFAGRVSWADASWRK